MTLIWNISVTYQAKSAKCDNLRAEKWPHCMFSRLASILAELYKKLLGAAHSRTFFLGLEAMEAAATAEAAEIGHSRAGLSRLEAAALAMTT